METQDIRQLVDQLKALNKELQIYGVDRLVTAAGKRGIDASRSVMREAAEIALGTEPAKQLFQPP